MKIIVAVTLFLLAGLYGWSEIKQSPIKPKEFKPKPVATTNVTLSMRSKLENTKQVLEGIALEDFEKIATGADKMNALTEADAWHVFNTPKYTELTVDFHKAVRQLTTAAKENDLEAATLRFMTVVTTCVSCHEHVRDVRVATSFPSLEELLAAN